MRLFRPYGFGNPAAMAPGGGSFNVAAFLAANVVAYWKMDEDAGSVLADATSRGNDLVHSQSGDPADVQPAAGKLGDAQAFIADNVDVCSRASTPDLQIDGDTIFCFWMKVSDLSEQRAICNKLGDYNFDVVSSSGGTIRFTISTPDDDYQVVHIGASLDVWHLVIARVHDGILQMNLNDGVPVNSVYLGTPNHAGEDFLIGGNFDAGTFFDGLIDDTLIIKPPRPGVLVSGAGTSAATVLYLYAGQTNGKAQYSTTGADPQSGGVPCVYWDGAQWLIIGSAGNDSWYASPDDTAFPQQAIFVQGDIGIAPAPTVAIDPAYEPLSDDQFNAICAYLWNGGAGRALF